MGEPSHERNDQLAWEHGEDLFQAWKPGLFKEELCYKIAAAVRKYTMNGPPVELCAPRMGSFNVQYRVRFSEGPGAVFRCPVPEYFQCAEEKLAAEIAAMRYVSENTTIPVPFIYHCGLREECPGNLSSFAVMDWVENSGDLVDALNTPGLTDDDPPVLDPNVNEIKLENLYGQMAEVLLQLWQCNFSKIGSLRFDETAGESTVTSRPFSINVLELGGLARVPHWELPPMSKTFKTSSEYYCALADMHLQQLSYQRNQAIESAEDGRRKYVARQLFRKLAAENRLADPESEHGPFKLWCDDLRPANVLMTQDQKISGLIDWEFSYAAPPEFLYSAPWWLLLRAPDDWKAGLDDWTATFEPRFATFLRALEAKERAIPQGTRVDDEPHPLSKRMRESWESGRFWVAFAARRTWAFDGIFWKYLDEKFFGENKTGSYKERIHLLPQAQVDAMEEFVQRKLQEKDEGTIVDWYEPGAQMKLPQNVLLV